MSLFDPAQGPQLTVSIKNARRREAKDAERLYSLIFAGGSVEGKEHTLEEKSQLVREELCKQAAKILGHLSVDHKLLKMSPASTAWRAQIDLYSLPRQQLLKFLDARGVTPPEHYDQGDLVKLAQQTQFVEEQKKREAEKERGALEAAAKESAINFRLNRKPSSITGAGDGVFIETASSGQTLRAGSLLAFYPGSVYAPPDMLAVYPHIYIDNSYLITRLDETLIDANPSGMSNRVFKMSWQRDRMRTTEDRKEKGKEKAAIVNSDYLDFPSIFDNPYAVGHLVNHPPAGTQPNVMCFHLDFTTKFFTADVHPYIPNIYFRPTSHQASKKPKTLSTKEDDTEKEDAKKEKEQQQGEEEIIIMKGMVMINTRDLTDGEELFLDYHFNTKSENLPSWYSPVVNPTSIG